MMGREYVGMVKGINGVENSADNEASKQRKTKIIAYDCQQAKNKKSNWIYKQRAEVQVSKYTKRQAQYSK